MERSETEMDKSLKAPKEREELLNGLIMKKYIANARNLSDWYVFEEQAENGNDHRILTRKNAMTSWLLSDYCYAAAQFRIFPRRRPPTLNRIIAYIVPLTIQRPERLMLSSD